ncbi:cytochrome ubiquinol oxidase subunit II [Rhodobacteraceae bacterium NNCM2]|nr:cytochrome ubiquinol oxidase subunit II [Coraliihabitans acroporae]
MTDPLATHGPPPSRNTLTRERAARLIGGSIALATLTLLAGCNVENISFMDPQGPIAAEQKAHLFRVMAITMIAVLPVLVLVPILLWRYRYRNGGGKYAPNWEYSGLLDAVMWGVPVLIIIVLSTQLWHSTKALDPYKPIDSDLPPVKVQVVALDWKWLFIYPELGIASMGELAFPAKHPVALDLTADTVMQSFMIGALAGQIYTMPGMRTQQHLIADAPGTFEGENTQFNGDGFAKQKFNAIAMSEQDFDTWVASVRAEGIALDEQSYGILGKPSTAAESHAALGTPAMPPATVYFNAVPQMFFHQIMSRYHSGTPLPRQSQPGSAVFGDPLPEGAANHTMKGSHKMGTQP